MSFLQISEDEKNLIITNKRQVIKQAEYKEVDEESMFIQKNDKEKKDEN